MPEYSGSPPKAGETEPLAGLPSVKMSLTSEPAFDKKRKQPEHEKNVTFLTDHAEHISSKSQDDKTMRFRAGFRQTYPTLPTTYQWHYTWKTPLDESPLLTAAASRHTTTETHHRDKEEEGERGARLPASGAVGGTKSAGMKPSEETQVVNGVNKPSKPSVKATTKRAEASSVQHSDPPKPASTQTHQKQRPPAINHKGAELIQTLLDSRKQPASKSPRHHRKHKKKKHSVRAKQPHFFISTYAENYKAWSIPTAGKESNAVIAGSPKKLTDVTDPRLLKHCPLPVPGMFRLPSSQWGSEYTANFPPPSKLPTGAESSDTGTKQEASWFDQLLQLRQEAQLYKQRSEETHFSPHHLFLLSQDQLQLLERASGSTLTSSSSSAVSTHSSISSSSLATTETADSQASQANSEGSCGDGEGMAAAVAEGGLVVEDIEEGEPSTRLLRQSVITAPPALSKAGAVPKPVSETGRIPTPILQTAPETHHRHHLDRTTPSEGGLITSPLPISLPYPPPSSPKYRRDMKSKAPIFPSPQPSRYPSTSEHPPPPPRSSLGASYVAARTRESAGGEPLSGVHIHLESGNGDEEPGGRKRNAQVQTDDEVPPASLSSDLSPSSPARLETASHGDHRQSAPAQRLFTPSSPASSGAHRKLRFEGSSSRMNVSKSTHHHHPSPSFSSCCQKQPLFVRECTTCGAKLRSPKKPTSLSYLSQYGSGMDRSLGLRSAPAFTSLREAPTAKLPFSSAPQRSPSPTGPLLPGKREQQDDDEDDDLSLETLSLSSCSVASDLLHRAQERSHFWNSHRAHAVET